MTAPAQEIRKLAEEIADSRFHMLGMQDPRSDFNRQAWGREVRDWEARLRSTLPELNHALGELAVAREAARFVINEINSRRSLQSGSVWLGDGDCSEIVMKLRSSPSDAGRLAEEALTALLDWYETPGHDCRSDEENVLQQMAAQLRVEFPGLRAEVER